METRYIKKELLLQWLSHIKNDGSQLFAPVAKGGKTDFKRIHSVEEISLDHIQSIQSIKSVAFPRTEKLFSYVKEGRKISLENFSAEALPHRVIFGLHPCDAIGFKALSRIFNWDSEDLPFNERMKRTTLIGMGCVQSDEYCFCTSVNGGPGNTEGSDILLTPAENGFIAEIISGRGEQLANAHASLFEDASHMDKEKYLAILHSRFTLDELKEKTDQLFDSHIWEQQSARCLGCGACAFVCPTCACFDIQEDAKGKCGSRLRCWDSCGFSQFTLHTSGHNPRDRQGQRWRQRLLHKFAYMPDRLSVTGCTGCGRCSRACPVDMNIQEHLEAIAHAEV